VDGLQVQGMTEDEGNLLFLAEVGQPVPAEEARAADDQVVAVRCNGLQQELGLGVEGGGQDGVSGLVEEREGRRPGVESDAAVESMLGGVEAHGPGLRGVGSPEPAAWLAGASCLKIPPTGSGTALIPFTQGDRLLPISPGPGTVSPALHLTRPA